MNKSIWKSEINLPRFPVLMGEITTDILIIGGGIAGILTAHFLHQKGVDCILLEGSDICSGTTGNTTAKITSQHGMIYGKMADSLGLDTVKSYIEINETAIEKFKELAENIDCDFQIKDNFVYSISDNKKIEKELKVLENTGFNAEFQKELPLPIKTVGAIKFKNQAQFNPLKFIKEISKNLNIYEHSFVQKVDGTTAHTANGKVTAKKIIIATHFPFINRHGSYFLKQYQHRSYCLALENAKIIDGMYVDEADTGFSFRNYENMLILGGGGHRTGKNGGNWRILREFAKKNYPDATEKYYWAAQDCKTLDDIPYIGNYSALTPNIYVATGFNKWGMTSSMVSATILSNLVCEEENEYAQIFSPSRSILKPQLLVNGYEAITNLINFKTKRCPHLGCALVWNKAEHTWDCPCHGSRFDEKGNVLENPAMKNIRQ